MPRQWNHTDCRRAFGATERCSGRCFDGRANANSGKNSTAGNHHYCQQHMWMTTVLDVEGEPKPKPNNCVASLSWMGKLFRSTRLATAGCEGGRCRRLTNQPAASPEYQFKPSRSLVLTYRRFDQQDKAANSETHGRRGACNSRLAQGTGRRLVMHKQRFDTATG